MRNIFKTHKIFIVLFIISALFLSMGCGGGGGGGGSSSKNGGGNSEDIPIEELIPEPDPEPVGSGYIVTFDSNGGSSVENQIIAKGSTADMPDAPTKENYVFAGWYTDNDSFTNLFLFGERGDVINSDITLYAQWIEDNQDSALVQYALSEINIGYQNGDNAGHVTENLILPELVDEVSTDVSITWESSNPGVISAAGNVVRPQGSDADVTLTATASKGSENGTKTFRIKVIHAHTRAISSITNHSMVAIQNLSSNDANGLYVTYDKARSQVSTIDGRFSEFNIENADDASDAIYGIRSILGIADPKSELKPSVIASNSYGASYSFQQYYKDVKVYGRGISASANAEGVGHSVNSSIITTAQLESADRQANNTLTQPVITEAQASNAALSYHGSASDFTITEEPELIIYTLDEYKANPVLAYIVGIQGGSGETYYDEKIFINASDGTVFKAVSNIRGQERLVRSRGIDELGNDVSFDVTFTPLDFLFYYMRTKNPNIEMYTKNLLLEFRVGSEFNTWRDGQQISAYVNMQKILNWWKSEFDRNALDGNGSKLKVVAHDRRYKDNAYWNGIGIYICEIGNTSIYKYSRAIALDTLTHETTHGVIHYCAPLLAVNYEKAPGAINEGYADVFGCLRDRDWKHGRTDDFTYFQPNTYECLRDIANPASSNAASNGPVKLGSAYEVYNSTDPNDMSDNYGVHYYSFLVSHAAYLMWSYMSEDWDTLGRLWYESIFKDCGLNRADADFHTVRAALLRASDSHHLNLSFEWRKTIRRAFNEEDIFAPQGSISGTVVDPDGNPIADATISAYYDSELIASVTTGSDGRYALSLDAEFEVNSYDIQVQAINYSTLNVTQGLEADVNTALNVTLVTSGIGTVNGIVTSALTGKTMSGVSINVLSGWNTMTGSPVRNAVTDASGRYSFTLDAGYYTLELKMDGYATSYIDIVSAGGQTRTYDRSISTVMDENTYRIVLRWAQNPRDLDSHLVCRRPDGSEQYHIYYPDEYKEGYDDAGQLVASLDIDDRNGEGPETITVKLDLENTYTYFVHWYVGSSTWAASGANVAVFHGENVLADQTHAVPTAGTDYNGYEESWIVFKILPGGNFQTVDMIDTNRSDAGEGVARTLKMPAKEKGDRNNN